MSPASLREAASLLCGPLFPRACHTQDIAELWCSPCLLVGSALRLVPSCCPGVRIASGGWCPQSQVASGSAPGPTVQPPAVCDDPAAPVVPRAQRASRKRMVCGSPCHSPSWRRSRDMSSWETSRTPVPASFPSSLPVSLPASFLPRQDSEEAFQKQRTGGALHQRH